MSVPPPPPAIAIPNVVIFAPGPISCGGTPVSDAGIVHPFPVALVQYGRSDNVPAKIAYAFSFDISADGRASRIRGGKSDPSINIYINTEDLAPSLAVSQFAASSPRADCSITYTASIMPVRSAPMQSLYEIVSRPRPGVVPTEVSDRVKPIGAQCTGGPGQYRQLNLPAYEKFKQPTGTFAWIFLSYDVRADGKVVRVMRLGSSGNRMLDEAGTRALQRNRYAPGPGYRGCTYYFYRAGEGEGNTPQLPPGTPADTGELDACRIDPKTMQSLLGGSAYPEPFALRKVEGLAVVSYDTAPWGEIGNVRVIASEPAEAFGEAAKRSFFNAKVRENDVGHRGCVRRIRFKLPPAGKHR